MGVNVYACLRVWLCVASCVGVLITPLSLYYWYHALKPQESYFRTTCHVLDSHTDSWDACSGERCGPRGVRVFTVTVGGDLRGLATPLEAFRHASRGASTAGAGDPWSVAIKDGTDVPCWQNERQLEIVKLDGARDKDPSILVPLLITVWCCLWWAGICITCWASQPRPPDGDSDSDSFDE